MNYFKQIFNKYEPEFDNYIKIVLKSGLILDEDIESILSNYTLKKKHLENWLISKVLISNILINTAILAGIRSNYLSVSLIVLSPSVFMSLNRLWNYFKKRRHQSLVERLLGNLRKLLKQNRVIYSYLKERNVNSCTSNDDSNKSKGFEAFNKSVEDLMKSLLTIEVKAAKLLLNDMKTLYKFTPILENEYKYLEDIEFSTESLENIESCLENTSKLNDILILVISNYLTSIVFVFMINFKGNTPQNAGKFLNEILPKTNKNLSIYFEEIQTIFNQTKSHLINENHLKIIAKNSTRNFISSKLHNSLTNSMLKIPIILEKSQNILQQLTEMNVKDLNQKHNLAKSLEELNTNTREYHESLEILTKLYQISLNISPPQNPQTIQPTINAEIKPELATISSDYFNEPLKDETYELFNGNDDDCPGENPNFDNTRLADEEEAGKFLSLLTQELKQNLKEHKKFVAAREKHGIVDEVVTSTKPVALPSEINLKDSLIPETEIRMRLPPPLPPPLPLNPAESTVKGLSVSDSIKSIGFQRQIVEDVFEDSSEELLQSDEESV